MGTILQGVRSAQSTVWRQWLSHSRADLWILVFLVGGHVVAVKFWNAPAILETMPVAARPSLYAASAVVISLTGTLGSVTVAQYLTGRGDRVKALKEQFPDELARTWRGVFLSSIFASVMFLAAFAADSEPPGTKPNLSHSIGSWLFEVAVIISLLRLIRLVLLFSDLIDLIVLDDVDPLSRAADDLNPEFFASPEQHQKTSTP